MIDTLLTIFLFSFVLFINNNNKKNSNNDIGNQVLTLTLGDFLSWACLWLFLEPEEEWLPVDFARMCERWLLSDVEEDEEVESKGPDRDVFIIFSSSSLLLKALLLLLVSLLTRLGVVVTRSYREPLHNTVSYIILCLMMFLCTQNNIQ